MPPTILRQVVDTTDAYLRRFTHEYPKVFAKFTADDCPLCAELAPCFARFANDPANKDILFVRLSADENPVAQQLLQKRAAPFL
jgi:thioredoxin 1